MEELTYENIRITLDGHQIKQTNMKKFRMLQQLSDHGRVTFAGAVGEDSFIESVDETTVIRVDYVSMGDGTSDQASQQVVTPWFRGIATNCKLSMVGREYNYEIEGASFTYLMDLKLKQRSFQDAGMTYQTFVDEITEEYDGVASIGKVFDGKSLQQIILQYKETDWEFLKRIASYTYMPLVANFEAEKVKFCFGIPEGQDDVRALDDLPYVVHKRLSDYRNSKQNFRKNAAETDFIGYEISLIKVNYLKLGQYVKLNDTTPKLVVVRAELVVNHDQRTAKGHFYAKYLLVPEDGLQQNRQYNQSLVGASLTGKVIEVKQDRVKVHLDIDKDRKQETAKSWLFPYMTPYTAENHTGWYCMPEVGDTVNLYFPTNKEEESVVIHSYRKEAKENDKIASPEVKYFRTKFGKELEFTDKEILITGKDGEILIRLNEDEGIEIQSSKKVTIAAAGELTIHSDLKVNLQAGTGLELVCKDSSITMDAVTHIKGKQIKTN